MNISITLYLVGAGVWMFAAGFNHALWRSKWTARAFFAFPVWPVALVALILIAAVHMWKTAAWGTESPSLIESRRDGRFD